MKIKILILWTLYLLGPSSDLQALSYERLSGGHFTPIHVLVVSPKEHTIKPVQAEGTVKSVVKEYNAIAGINGDFKYSSSSALIQNGHIVAAPSSDSRDPRTAIGVKENGEWVFVVVDGRFYGLFGGMTIQELSTLMLQLGCIEAFNLNGGSSSTMVLGSHVVNKPCGDLEENGKSVRSVPEAILIF